MCVVRCNPSKVCLDGMHQSYVFLFLGPKCLSDHLSQFESVCKKSAKSEEESILGLNAERKEATR